MAAAWTCSAPTTGRAKGPKSVGAYLATTRRQRPNDEQVTSRAEAAFVIALIRSLRRRPHGERAG